jgi:hypothetical protein
MLEGAGQQLPFEIDGKEARAGVYVLVAGHEFSSKRDALMTLDIPFGSRQDARMKRLFLQLRWATEMPMHYAARCRFTYARNASFMRVCQPSPVARKYSTTSGLYRTVTATLVGCFCGPRWPGRRTLPFAQNAFTEAASLGSYGHSGSFTLAGAAAMAAAICSLLKVEGFEVGARFMFVTVTTGNQSSAVIALNPYQEDDAVVKPAQTLQALLAVMFALIFHRDHRGIENTSDLSQIDAVILEVPFPLGFVPR